MIENSAVKQLKSFLGQGDLIDKYVKSCDFLESGESSLFSGDIDWNIYFMDDDRYVTGHADSVDSALLMMRNCMTAVLETYPENTQVICAMRGAAK